jgi:hypothetical protein
MTADPKPGHVRLVCEECGDIGEDVLGRGDLISEAMEEHWANIHQPFMRIVHPAVETD